MQERKMTKKEKSKEKRLKKKYDDSDMKASMKKQYGKDWKAVYYATIRKRAMEQANEGYQILPPIDKERYTEIPGMEGPMMTRSGKVVYYDPQEGAYYDRDTDMYLSYDEWKELDEDSPMKTAIDKAVAQAMSTPAPAYSVRPKARPKNLAPSSSLRPRARPTINIGSVRKGDPATRGIDPRDNYSPEDLKRLLIQSAMERLQTEGEAGDHDRMYKVVHAKKGVMDIKAKTSYEAAKKFAKEKGLKSTAGVDAHLYPLEEGKMSDLHAQIMSSDDPHEEIYKMLTGDSPEERYIQSMYNDTSAEYGLHPDDDFEDIIDRMVHDMDGDMSFEGHSPHKKGTKKYKAHMAAMHANSAEPKGKMLEGYEGEVSAILQALDIEHHWSNGYLHVNQRDLEDVKNRLADTDMDMPSIKVYEGNYGKKKKKKKKYETVDIKKVKSAVNMQESTDSQAVAEYIRINLNESHDTWEKVNEEVYHVIGNLTEGHSADPLEVYSAVHKRHMQQYFDHEMGIKENVNTLRKIVKDRSAMTVKFEDGTMKVDMTTANIFLQAYDQMKERNQEKIDQMMRTKAGFLRVMDFIYGAMK